MKSIFKAVVLIAIFGVAGIRANADSIASAIDTVAVKSDSVKVEEAMTDMLNLVAHFEGVKINAYWDPHGRVWTIGIGNTVRPDGRKVRRGDRIADKEELMAYFSAHVRKYMLEDMCNFLDIDKMSGQEIAALGSLCYNCGTGILGKEQPSELATAINEYVETRSTEAQARVKSLMDKKVTAKGRKLAVLVKRRAVEEMILFGEINMVDSSEYALENSVNFAEVSLGAAYSVKLGQFDDATFVTDSINNCSFGRNLNDSIEYAFAHPAPQKKLRPRAQPHRRTRR